MEHVLKKLGMLVAMLLAFLPASAYDFEVDGIYYRITSMSDLEVGVTHADAYAGDDLSSNNSYSGKVTIPATVNFNNLTFTVTSILNSAMGGYNSGSNVTTVVIPSTVTEIEGLAFSHCYSLSECVLPDNLKVIGYNAFEETAISEIIIPNETTEIGSWAFYDCDKLVRVIIGRNVNEIGDYAFKGCGSLLEMFFTGLVPPSIGDSALSSREEYVPSISAYGFGKEYLTFANSSFVYSGQSHCIEWTNNLKAYKCEISEAECKTQVNAGTYTQNLKATYSTNGVDLTVEIPYTYTINKAPMTLNVGDVNREYGEPNPEFTCNISGFVNGESEQSLGVTPSFECEATQLSSVGTYRILASFDVSNYEITYGYGTLSVLKAPLSVSVVNATRVYGDRNPVFELAYTGLKNGESAPMWIVEPTVSTIATRQSGVGEYAVSIIGGEAKNYDMTTYTPGTLTVSKRNLTAKAIDCERLYGEDNPEFKISYVGFVNEDDESSLTIAPVAECSATKESNAGQYPISVTGGHAENYNFVYQDGQLTVNPLTVGFKEAYSSVIYNDMSVSTSNLNFNYIPEIVGPFSEDDFWIELWFLDKDNKYDDYVCYISGGDYAGNYVNTNSDRTMDAGKYIFNLTPKGTNPNVVANPSRAYVTVNSASNNLEWNASSPITVEIGKKVDLGISYQADMWCTFDTDYDNKLIELSADGENGSNPHWYATGLKEGETTVYFSIECHKNDMGFYNFNYSPTRYKTIRVIPSAGIENVTADVIDSTATVEVYNLNGVKVSDTVNGLPTGIYIVRQGSNVRKISVK